MTIQAYVDDSSWAREGSPLLVLAGYVAPAEIWSEFNTDWNELLPWTTLDKNGVSRFKMNEMNSSTEGMFRFPAFYRVIERHIKLAISISIFREDLIGAKMGLWVNDSRFDVDRLDFGGLDNLYMHASAALITMVVKNRAMLEGVYPDILEAPIDFYFDHQTEKERLKKAWVYSMSQIDGQPQRTLYGSLPQFRDDAYCPPLQAADLWAWWVRHNIQKSSPTGWASLANFDGMFEKNVIGPNLIHLHLDQRDISRVFLKILREQLRTDLVAYSVNIEPLIPFTPLYSSSEL